VYRAEAEQIEVFAPLVPIDRVWVETVATVEPTSPSTPSAGDVFSRLVSLERPPRRAPVAVRDMPIVSGRRVVLSEPSRTLRDFRAVTEVYQSSDGDVCVRVCSELEWYRWAWNGQLPRTREVADLPALGGVVSRALSPTPRTRCRPRCVVNVH